MAVLAIGVPSATGHPEECAGTAAWASTDGGYSPYLSWQGAEASICTSKSVTSRYDDSDAKLTRSGQAATAGMRLIASRATQGPFAPYAMFNSDLAFDDGYAYQGNYEGVHRHQPGPARRLGGPEGLGRPRPVGAREARERADRLRLAYAYGAARGEPPAGLRPVL